MNKIVLATILALISFTVAKNHNVVQIAVGKESHNLLYFIQGSEEDVKLISDWSKKHGNGSESGFKSVTSQGVNTIKVNIEKNDKGESRVVAELNDLVDEETFTFDYYEDINDESTKHKVDIILIVS